MAPMPGGAADKMGNRYEGIWAVRHALYCIQSETSAMTLEELDPELAKGSEFTFVEGAAIQVHQVKRQYSTNPGWSVHGHEKVPTGGQVRSPLVAK